MYDWPTYIDPAVGSDFSDSIAICNLYDSLVFPTPEGVIKPSLAVEWKNTSDTSYVFTLRKGAKFHNGDEVTAEDVVFSLERLLAIGEGYAYLYSPYVQEAKAVDNYTVQIDLKKTFGPFITTLPRFYILNKSQVMEHLETPGAYGDFGDYGKKWLLTNDAGSGPYKVKENKMEEYFYAEMFPDYWAGWDKDAPKFFKMSASQEPSSQYALLAQRQLEMTDGFQPMESLNEMAKIEGVKISSFPTGATFNIMLHTKKPPTDDIHFRKALAYCLDYKTMVGLRPGVPQSRGPVAAVTPGFDQEIQPFQQDLAKAEEELKQSIYYDQLDQLPVQLVWVSEVGEMEKIALLFQANAAAIGIKVEITKKPFGSVIADVQSPETTPNASMIIVAPHYNEAGSMLSSRYHSSSVGTWEQTEWLQDPEVDLLIEDALLTVDQTERYAKYALAQKKIVELCPTIWLYDRDDKYAYQDAYLSWLPADTSNWNPIMGYALYAHDIRVFPEKREALLNP
jgi:peptide/nickel transport system substrate-binding protein